MEKPKKWGKKEGRAPLAAVEHSRTGFDVDWKQWMYDHEWYTGSINKMGSLISALPLFPGRSGTAQRMQPKMGQ
eukprot:1160482-Pelagomonas_calceolata.AAC.9